MNLKDRFFLYLLGGKYPDVKGYTVVTGFVSGNELKCESFEGGEIWLSSDQADSLIGCNFGIIRGVEGFDFQGLKPFVWSDGKTYSVSPIQKKSFSGWIRTEPKSHWIWVMKKLQDKDVDGNFISGTEKGFCYRSTPCWRVDFPGTLIDGVLRHWIASGGHLSFKKYD